MKLTRLALLIGFLSINQLQAQDIPVVQIDSVTVINDQSVLIDWQPSNDARVDGYIIYRVYKNNLGNIIFTDTTTVYGKDTQNWLYTDQVGQPDYPSQGSLRFYITAFDHDVNPNIQSNIDTFASKPHQTLFFTQNVDICNGLVHLRWNEYANAYNGWSDGVSTYEVWESQNDGPFMLKFKANATSFIRRDLQKGVAYRYKIRAISGNMNKTSTSNVRTLTGNFFTFPADIYLANVSVAVTNRTATLTVITSDSTEAKLTYKVLMSTDSINYQVVQQQDSLEYRRSRQFAIDNLIAERNRYYFRILTECSCPDTLDTSNVAQTILLKAQYIDDMTNVLTWNPYEEWEMGVYGYIIFRVLKDGLGNNVASTIDTVGGNIHTYIDNDPELLGQTEVTSYYIRAIENQNNPFSVQGLSQSNFAYIYKDLKIVAPNAFTPNGLTTTFRPRVLTATANKFNMKIYNRWGKLLYDTNDEFAGWNGVDRDSGQIAPTGAYVYVIEITDSTGKTLRKVGTIALLD